jgi:cellulose synthase/poly-beta-1,6-N-acetylglucosamine synthase-like glycosyltransferase
MFDSFIYEHAMLRKSLITYLKMLPLLLEHDGTVTPCGGPFLLLEVFLVWLQVYLVPEHHVSSIALLLSCRVILLFSQIVCRSFCSSYCFIPAALVNNTYPKEYTSNNKGRVVTELKVTFYAIDKCGRTF